MEPWLSGGLRLGLLLVACAVLSSIEVLYPLFQYRRGRLRRAIPNLMLALGVVLVNLLLAASTASILTAIARKNLGLLPVTRAHSWISAIAGVAGLDLFAYMAHRLLHKMPIGWRFHRVHHSEPEVDVTTAFRQHPVETLWRALWQFAGTIILGVPLWTVALYLSLSSLNALFEHANVKMSKRLDSWLRLVIVTPHMHKVHHSRQARETDSNYSNIFSLWDRICGTYAAGADYRKLRYGLDGFDKMESETFTALLCGPFRSS